MTNTHHPQNSLHILERNSVTAGERGEVDQFAEYFADLDVDELTHGRHTAFVDVLDASFADQLSGCGR